MPLPARPAVRVCLGGTFDRFHVGHAALLDAALEGATHLFVGVTKGPLATRDRTVATFGSRAASVEEYLAQHAVDVEWDVRPLVDQMGPAATGAYDRIVVSPETQRGAEAINAQRSASGLPALEVRVVPHRLAEDLLPVSATRIAAGDIDDHGRRSVPVRIAVGSANPVKVAAVEQEFAALLDLAMDVSGHAVDPLVPEQPRGAEMEDGARNRALAARAARPDADYAVGIEAGLVQGPARRTWFDVHAAVVVDRDDWQTEGWGPGFQYPDWVTERARAGEMVSDILGPAACDPRIGGTTGAIGFLSDGHMDRTGLSRIAVRMAMVPRIGRDLYLARPV